MVEDHSLRLFLCGDVMTGRGIDQALPHPGNPTLHEVYVQDAREYVRLAEYANGPIPRPVSPEYIWGDALYELEKAGAEFRIINLETSITQSAYPWPGKGINYRMHPRNIGCLSAARIDCCCLANNHVLDWGYKGLQETLKTLDAAGLRRAGAGRDAAEARAPAVLEAGAKGRVVVFSLGSVTSGIPRAWAATQDRAGVNLLEDLSDETWCACTTEIARTKRPGDVVIVSIHWGGNWGYDIHAQQVRLAHQLIEHGADIVHGHSSHHAKGLEVYRNRLIIYGCGDFVNDYEGIRGYEEYRGDLALMYLVRVQAKSGRLVEARLVPLQMKRFRLGRIHGSDARWLCEVLNREGQPFHTAVRLHDDDSMTVHARRTGEEPPSLCA